jgi:isoquinoline 1-oxidoreductase beta subunit
MTVTRRAFLRDGSKALVGLTLAFHLDVDAPANTAEVKAFAPNAFIRIGPDNIVRLWAIRSEMGQGVRTVLPMVLADELEADWQKVVIEQAEMVPRFKGIRCAPVAAAARQTHGCPYAKQRRPRVKC